MNHGRPRRRVALASVAVSAMALAVTAGMASAKPNDNVVITVASQAGGTNVGFEAVASNFMKANPNVTVKNIFLPIATYAQTIDTEFQAGNAPDIVYGSAGSGNANSLLPRARAGQLVDLSKRVWATRVPKELKPYAYLGKKLYMLPLNLVAVGAVYNADLMKANGWKPPTTFKQLLSLCAAAKAKGLAAWSIGGQFPNISGAVLASSIVYSADPKWTAKRYANKVTFAGTPTWHKTLQRWVDMKNAGCFPQGVEGMGIPQALSLMASGRALWYVAPAGVENSIKGINPNFHGGFFTIPSGDTAAQTRATVGWTDSLGVNAKSPNLQWALKYIDFLARQGQSRLIPKANDAVSFTDFNQGKVPDILKPITAQLKDPKRHTDLANTLWPNGDIYTALGQGMTGLLTGQKTIDQVLQDMDAAWNKNP